MKRYRLRVYGSEKVIATVRAASPNAARELVGKSRGIHPGDLRCDEVRERIDLTCSKCGWVYKGAAPFSTMSTIASRCVVCEQEHAVARIVSRLQTAQAKLARLRAQRAAQRERRGEP